MNGNGLKFAIAELAGLLWLLVARPLYAGDDLSTGLAKHEQSNDVVCFTRGEILQSRLLVMGIFQPQRMG